MHIELMFPGGMRKLDIMSKTPKALTNLTPATKSSLQLLGENLRVARLRRNETLKSWAAQLGVSIPTLMRIEVGDPNVGLGLIAASLQLIGREGSLPDVAAPEHDRGALEVDVQTAIERNGVRTQVRRRRR